MLAHQNDGDLRGESTERRSIGIGEGDMMPGPGVGKARLMEEFN